MLKRKIRYSLSEIDGIQKRVYIHSVRGKKALKLIRELERKLSVAQVHFGAAKKKCREAEKELEVIGVTSKQTAFRVDDDGYVVPRIGPAEDLTWGNDTR